jgi:hypothetical protein
MPVPQQLSPHGVGKSAWSHFGTHSPPTQSAVLLQHQEPQAIAPEGHAHLSPAQLVPGRQHWSPQVTGWVSGQQPLATQTVLAGQQFASSSHFVGKPDGQLLGAGLAVLHRL